MSAKNILDRITTPHQLRRLGESELELLAEELRQEEERRPQAGDAADQCPIHVLSSISLLAAALSASGGPCG